MIEIPMYGLREKLVRADLNYSNFYPHILNGYFLLFKHPYFIKKMKKINVGIIGRNFGYKVIFKALKNIRDFNVIGFSVKKKKKLIHLKI